METLAVVSIIIIIGAVAFPFISQAVSHYRLSGASRELISAVRYAQSQAVKTQNVYIVRFSASDYNIIKSVEGNEETQETINLPPTITISDITLPSNQVSFSASGGALAGGSLKLNNNRGGNITIQITTIGQITSN